MEENPIRRRIIHFVTQNPGSTLLSVGRSLEINESTLRYHLKCLERRGDVDLKTLEGRRLVYPGPGGSMEGLSRRKDRKLDTRSRRLLSIIEGNPGMDHDGILEMTDLSKKEVLMVLRGLIRSRRIIMVEDEDRRRCSYYLTGNYYDSMFRYLVDLLLQGKIDEESFIQRKTELDRICGRD
jgi:predicted transcriptional regulator